MYGDGKDILFGSVYGWARLGYQMIQNPPLSFERFSKMLFPDDFITEHGMVAIGDMLSICNTGEIVREEEEKVETGRDIVEKAVAEMISEAMGEREDAIASTKKSLSEIDELSKDKTDTSAAE